MNRKIDVIATTISGSISDWRKVERIEPLFRSHGENNVEVHVLDSHAEARHKTAELARKGGRIVISAGGSGTFNSVLEGCIDSGVGLREIQLGFLRKGSADLIGKVLGMPDNIEAAVNVFVEAIRGEIVIPCDVIRAASELGDVPPRHFVGYGGAELFGEIPRFTENRFIKYYKGILGQLFGDLGPFFVGTSLAILSRLAGRIIRKPHQWKIEVDGKIAAEGRYQAMIIVNGDLGPELPFARSAPLGSGSFYLFAIRDQGALRIFRQLKHAWDASILKDPERWGMEAFCVSRRLVIQQSSPNIFPINVDGSTMACRGSAALEIIDSIHLLASRQARGVQTGQFL